MFIHYSTYVGLSFGGAVNGQQAGRKAVFPAGSNQSKPILPAFIPTVQCSLLGTADALLLQTNG